MIRKRKEKGLELWASADFNYMPGIGVTKTVSGKKVVAAGPNNFNQENISLPVIPDQLDQASDTVHFILVDGSWLNHHLHGCNQRKCV